MSLLQKIGLGFLVVLIAVGSAVFFSMKVTVDNPTSETLTFMIDDKEHSIEGNSQIEISVMPGNHTVKVGEDDKGTFFKNVFDYGSILNPLKSTYVFESIAYGAISDSEFETYYNDVTLDGSQLSGPFFVSDDVYFSKKLPFNFMQKDGYEWNYGLDTHEPEEEALSKGKAYAMFVKIYRKDDFLTMYAEDYGE